MRLLQPAARQLEQHRRLPLGSEQADRDFAMGDALVLQHQGESLHAAIAAGEEGGQIGGQPAQREQQRLAGFDFMFEFDTAFEHIRRLIPGQW